MRDADNIVRPFRSCCPYCCEKNELLSDYVSKSICKNPAALNASIEYRQKIYIGTAKGRKKCLSI